MELTLSEAPAVTDLGWVDWAKAIVANDTRSGTPSLVLGWTCEQRDVETQDPSDRPATLIRFEHQHGGYACLQASMIGAVLPLELSKQHIRSLDELIEVFAIFSSDGSCGFETQKAKLAAICPGLERWWLNGYVEMDQQARRLWDSALNRWFDAPPIRTGLEALIGFGPGQVEQFVGWSTVAFALDDERCVGTPVEFRKSDLETIRRFGTNHGLGEPELWFVWENSD